MPFDHFNLITGIYDKAGDFNLSEPLQGLLSLSPDNLLLDAGGGTGRVSAVLRGRVRNVVVADTSLGMLRHASTKFLITACAAVESLPFLSHTFDRILMMDALHHVLDQGQTARELWRVLAPGGRIVIAEPDIHKMAVKALAIGEKVLLMRSHFLSGGSIRALFSGSTSRTSIFKEGFNVYVVVEKGT